MMNIDERYFAKVLLFGEYSILLGSSAISIPYRHFSAKFKFIDKIIDSQLYLAGSSNKSLKTLADNYLIRKEYFETLLDLELFRKEINQGLYLESSIPTSYGLGSSGALCSALYGRFARNPIPSSKEINNNEILALREIFINMESQFHAKSSGFDPLVIYLNQPLWIDQKKNPVIISIPEKITKSGEMIFLVDTGLPVKTRTLVSHFIERFSPQGHITSKGIQLISLTDRCINEFLYGEPSLFFHHLRVLSKFQLKEFDAMIPSFIRPVWEEGLSSGFFYLKLCGSGGGGFLTGFTVDFHKTLTYFQKKNINILPVNLLQ